MADFTHLHVHSEYSLLDGLSKFGPLLDRVNELGMNSIALTDHGGMYGAIKFYFKAKASGIKPIIGVETYLAKRTRFDKDPKLDSDQYHLILLAKNENGYKNLMKLVTQSYLEGYYYKPRVDFDLLKEYHEDVIALSGCLSGIGQEHWKKGEDDQAEAGMLKLYEIFQDNFYAEIQRHKTIKDIEIVNPKLIAFAKKHAIPLVATADAHYINKEDAEAQEVLLCVQTQKLLSDPNRSLSMVNEPDFYIKSSQEMKELYMDLPQAIENTQRIADQVDITLDIGKLIFPKYPIPNGKTPEQYLEQLVKERTAKRYSSGNDEINDRIAKELDIIDKKGYATYFLIVSDFTNWAKDQGIGVGPGRGSAAGSIVSYILGITDLDPIYHNLPFERFLNPERASPPDIDMDFADDRREEVIEYVTKRYGQDHVAQIITFGTMEARAAVRDTGRVLGMSYSDCDRLSKMIPVGPQGFHISIDKALELSLDLKQAYDTEPETKRLLELAKKLEGVARHASVHAAGVVIGDKPLWEYTPLQKESKGDKIVTQYDMYSLDLNVTEDAVGLMKMDFLGLRNLTILQNAIRYVHEMRGIAVDLQKIPLDDPLVFDIIQSGNTTGIFQIESAGMRRLARDLRPSNFSDISAMIALFRPGPMDLIPDFIEGKKNAAKIKYPHPLLKDILSETYGIIVYQEQCMEIAVAFAGYTMGTADLLRRAIGKKKKEAMEKEKKKFITGAVAQGNKKEDAESIFALIEKFASYGFNKAHSAGYALITYQTAFMKAHYPTEFMAAVLSAEANAKMSGTAKEEKVSSIVAEAKRMGIEILPPDINHSYGGFTIEEFKDGLGKIRFSLGAIKNIGEAPVAFIVKEREEHGLYKDFIDFVTRTTGEKITKRTIESLIKAGALDAFGNRKTLLFALQTISEAIARDKKYASKAQEMLFAADDLAATQVIKVVMPEPLEEFPTLELLRFEKEFLGYYASNSSIFSEFDELTDLASHKIDELVSNEPMGDQVVLLCLITSIRKIMTKASNAEMAFIKLEDETGEIEGVIFPRTYAQSASLLVANQPVILCGKVDKRDDRPSLIVDQIISAHDTRETVHQQISEAKSRPSYTKNRFANSSKLPTKDASNATNPQSFAYELFIKRGTPRQKLEFANDLLRKNPGSLPLIVVLENRTSVQRINYPQPISWNDDLRIQLEGILGPGCIKESQAN